MEARWLNIFLKASGFLARLKKKAVSSNSLIYSLGYGLIIVAVELLFAFLSIPLFIIVPPKKLQEPGFIFPKKYRERKTQSYKAYIVRRKVSLATVFGAGGILVVKLLFISFVSVYLLGAQQLLAATQNWAFDTPANYTYDSAKIEVTGGAAQLKDTSAPASGSTTNSGFDSGSTGWSAVPGWDNAPGKANTASYQSSGGNPGGYVDIYLDGKKANDSAGYWYQAFTTTVDNPDTATLDLDWSSLGVTGTPDSYHLYAYVDAGSGNPVLSTEVWDSGNLTSTTSWASISQVDISSSLTTAGTYYLKIAAYTMCQMGTDCTATAGFDNAIVNWSGSATPSYATDDPTIVPTASLSPGSVTSWNSFTETATKNGGEIYYQLSDDDGATYQYWNGSTWASVVGATDYNTASTVNTNFGSFSTSANKIMWKAFLNSDGSQQVILSNLAIDYTLNDLPDVQNLSPAQDVTTGSVYIDYDLQDGENDPSSLSTYEYSTTGAFAGEEVTMTPDAGDPNHDGISGLSSSPSGVAHTFVWDAYTDLGAIYDASVYVRLIANDGIGDGSTATSGSFPVDYIVPVVSNVTAAQTAGTTDIVFTYDLADDTSDNLCSRSRYF